MVFLKKILNLGLISCSFFVGIYHEEIYKYNMLNFHKHKAEHKYNSKVIIIKNDINDNTKDQVIKDLNYNSDKDLDIIVDTPGGCMYSCDIIARLLLQHEKKVRFHIKKGFSGGTYITLAASPNEIYMDNTSILGPFDPQYTNEFGMTRSCIDELTFLNQSYEFKKVKKSITLVTDYAVMTLPRHIKGNIDEAIIFFIDRYPHNKGFNKTEIENIGIKTKQIPPEIKKIMRYL